MAQVKANGLTLEYDIHGKETDPVVILIMGFTAQMTMWPMSFVNGLVDLGFRVVRFDNRDIGLSTHLHDKGQPNIGAAMAAVAGGQTFDAPYVLDDMAADVIGLMDALNIKTAHIVGASMGGMIAQIVAGQYPDRTRSLTSIMSNTGKPGLPQPSAEVSAAMMTPPTDHSREARIAQFVKMFRMIGSVGFPATEEEIQTLAAIQVDRAPPDPAGISRQMVAIMCSAPRGEMLSKLKMPALVLHGGDDPLVNVEGGKDTAASIPGSKLVIVPGMGHDFTEALMPEFIRHVGGFLVEAEGKAKAKAA